MPITPGLYGWVGGNANVASTNTIGLYGLSSNTSILSSATVLLGLLSQNGNVKFALDPVTSNTKVLAYTANIGVTSGTYGNLDYFPVITVTGDGRVTNVSTISVASATGGYGNANVAAYLPTYTGSLENSSSVINLWANAASQQVSINSLTSNAATQASEISNLWANAATQSNQITSISSNLNSFEAYANATFGTSSYSNVDVAAYLVTNTGNVNAGYFTGNGAFLTGLPATYGNTQANAWIANQYGLFYDQFGYTRFTGGNTLGPGQAITITPALGLTLGGVSSKNNYIQGKFVLDSSYGRFYLDGYPGGNEAVQTQIQANSGANIGLSTGANITANSGAYINLRTGSGIVGNGTAIFANVSSVNGFFWSNGTPYGTATTYGNTDVAAYLPTYTGNIGGNVSGYQPYITTLNNITTGNIYLSNLNYILGSGSSLNIGNGNGTDVIIDAANDIYIGHTGTNASTVHLANVSVIGNATFLQKTSISGAANLRIANASSISVESGARIDLQTGSKITGNGFATFGNVASVNGYFWSNGTPYSTASTYGNTEVAAYLPTYTGSLEQSSSIVNLWSNAATQAAQINAISGNLNAFETYANATFGTSNYGNSNVAAYLPTYTGTFGTLSSLTSAGNVTVNPGGYFVGDGRYLTNVDALTAITLRIQVKNTSGGVLTKGTPVYATGTVGVTDVYEVSASRADTSGTMPAIGLLEQTLNNNDTGTATQIGLLSGVNTNSYTANQVLYIDITGGLTATRPNDGYLVQPIGSVGRVNSSTGSIFVNIWNTLQIPNLGQGNVWVGPTGGGLPVEQAMYGNTQVAAYLPTYNGNIGSIAYPNPLRLAGDGVELYAAGGPTLKVNPSPNPITASSNMVITGNVTATNYFVGNAFYLTNTTRATDGTYGDSTSIPQIIVDSSGRITSISNIAASGGSYGNANVAAYLPTYTGNIGGNVLGYQPYITTLNNISTGNISMSNLNYILGSGSRLNIGNGNGTDIYIDAANDIYIGHAGTNSSTVQLANVNVIGNANFTKLTSISSGANLRIVNSSSISVESGARIDLKSGSQITGNGFAIFGNVASVNGYFWANGTPYGTASTYGNTEVAAYLPTYSGNIGGTITTASQPYITAVGTLGSLTATGNITTTTGYFVGDGSYLTNLPAGSYGNTQVAAYLPTYTGNLAASNFTANVNYNNNYVTSAILSTTREKSANIGVIQGTVTVDASTGPIQLATVTANITINTNNITNLGVGQTITLVLTQNTNANSRILTSNIKYAGGYKTLSTANAAIDTITITYDGEKYLGSLVKGYA